MPHTDARSTADFTDVHGAGGVRRIFGRLIQQHFDVGYGHDNGNWNNSNGDDATVDRHHLDRHVLDTRHQQAQVAGAMYAPERDQRPGTERYGRL
jgi:hypothetical protein